MTASARGETPMGRMPRRGLRVPARLLAGALLVVGSAAGVAALVASADRSEPLLVARRVIAAGDPIVAGDLVAVPTRLARGTARYLHRVPRDGSVAARTIAAGELVPASAVESAAAAGTTSIVLNVTGQPAGAVVAGARVDVWSAVTGDEAPAAPSVLVADATVVRLTRDSGFGASAGAAIEVRVPQASTAAVLAAVAAGAQIAVLPAAG